MKHCHHFAVEAFQTVCYLANKWQLYVNIAWLNIMLEESMNKSFQPTVSSGNPFATDLAGDDFICACDAQTYGKDPGTQNPIDTENGNLIASTYDIGGSIQNNVDRVGTVTETMSRKNGAVWGIKDPLFCRFRYRFRCKDVQCSLVGHC